MTFIGMSKRRSLFFKAVSILIIQSFVLSSVAFAIPQDNTANLSGAQNTITNPDQVVIPREYGLVKSKYNGSAGKLIIHIQDAHCNYEAQSNIVKILENLAKNYKLHFVSVEGADGIIDTSWFKAFPDDAVRKEVADYFMKKGEITGPEFLSITTDYPIKLFGAETRAYYIENLNAFTSSYPLKEETEKYFNQTKSVLNKLKTYIYNEDLKALDAKAQAYESKAMQFNDYVRFLQQEAEKWKVNLREYDNFFKLVNVLVYEKKIDFGVTDKERTALIDGLSKKLAKDGLTELVSQSISFKVGKISSADYYAYLKMLALKNGVDLAKEYPNLYNYIIYNSVYSKIENEKLFADIKKLETDLKEKLFANDDQRTLERLSRHIDILIGLVNIKLLNADFDYYKTHKEEFAKETFLDFITKQAAQYGFAYEIYPPSIAVMDSIAKLEDFYAIAIKRDKALVDNTLSQMGKEDQKIAVLVTGGFHSEGIAKLLEKDGISYMVICPAITKDVPSPYIKILTNQRTPLEDILVGTAEAKEGNKEGMLAPMLRTQLCSLSEKELSRLIKDIRFGKELEVNVKILKDRWIDIYINGLRIAKVDGYLNHARNGVGGVSSSTNYIVESFIKQLAERSMRLGRPQAETDSIIASVKSKLPAQLSVQMEKTAARALARKGAKPMTEVSPGESSVEASVGPFSKISIWQHDEYNKLIKQSIVENTYEIRTVMVNSRPVDFYIHYGLEDRIYARNVELGKFNEALAPDRRHSYIPWDIEAHPGRGGREFNHSLTNVHLSGLKFYFFVENEIGIIAAHELAHIDIANGIQILIDRGVIRESIADLLSLPESAISGLQTAVKPTCLAYIKALRANPNLNEEDFVDSLPGCDTRTSGIRDKFIEVEKVRSRSAETLAKLEREEPIDEKKLMEGLEAITKIDRQFEIGSSDVKRVLTKIRDHSGYRMARDYIKDYLAHRAMLDYITKTREIASSKDKGFDVYVFVSTSATEADYWQKRFEATRGQALPKDAVVLSVYSEDSSERVTRWRGQTNNGSASLYAFTLAEDMLANRMDHEPDLRKRLEAKYGKQVSLMSILNQERPVMMMLMAGKGTRMQPMAANNKSAILLPDTVMVDGKSAPLTVGEAVARTFGPLAASRGGRITEVWGDQINLPGLDIDSDQKYAAEIFSTIYPFDTEEDRAYAVQKGVLVGTSDAQNPRDVVQREKPPVEDISARARNIDGTLVADLSLGFNSYRWELLSELIKMYKQELDAKRGAFNIDSELWSPMTFDTAQNYADFMWQKRIVDLTKKLNDKNIDQAEYGRRASKAEEDAYKKKLVDWWQRIYNMRKAFAAKYGPKYRIENDRQGVIGRVDYGFHERSTDWWDFGQVKDYYNSLMVMLFDSADRDMRRKTWSAERVRRYFGIRNKDEWVSHSFTGNTKIDNSIVLGCNIARGNIKNSILINVTAEEVNAENAIIIGSTVYRLIAKDGSNIVQNVMSEKTIRLDKGDILVSHCIPGQGQKLFKVNWLLTDPNSDDRYVPEAMYSKKDIFDNPMSFDALSVALKQKTKEEQDIERERVMAEVKGGIDRHTGQIVVRMLCSALLKGDRKTVEAYATGEYARQLKERGILTADNVGKVMARFNSLKPNSRARTEMIFLCNIAMNYDDPAIKALVKQEKEDLLGNRIGLGQTIDPEVYKRDSVRALADVELPDATVKAAGAAYVMTLTELIGKTPDKITIAIGRESRESGGRILNAFVEGAMATGATVIDCTNAGLERTSTPLMYFASRYLENGKLDGIIEVTASHLKAPYNGLKPTVGVNNFSADEMQKWLQATHDIVDKGIPQQRGVLRAQSIMEPYYILLAAGLEGSPEWLELVEQVWTNRVSLKEAVDKIRPKAEAYMNTRPLEKMNLLADSSFGSMGPIAKPIMEMMGVDFDDLGGVADLNLAVHDANPNNPDNLESLLNAAKSRGSVFGMGFDADGDRLGVVTRGGKILRGDDISCITAPVVIRQAIEKAERAGVKNYKPVVVINVLCSERLKRAIVDAGGIPIECAVGFNKVKEAMTKKLPELYNEQYPGGKGLLPAQTAEMGVEISSHIMFKENFNADDAFFAVIKLLSVLRDEAQAKGPAAADIDAMLSALDARLGITDYHTGEWRTPMKDNQSRLHVAGRLKEHYEKVAKEQPHKYSIRNTLDGIKVDFLDSNRKSRGFLAIRPSGTSAEIVVAINSLVSQDAFNIIKNDFFAQMAQYKDYITWKNKAGKPALEPGVYYEQANGFVYEGKSLSTGMPQITVTPGTSAIRSGEQTRLDAFEPMITRIVESESVNSGVRGDALKQIIEVEYALQVSKEMNDLTHADKAIIEKLYRQALARLIASPGVNELMSVPSHNVTCGNMTRAEHDAMEDGLKKQLQDFYDALGSQGRILTEDEADALLIQYARDIMRPVVTKADLVSYRAAMRQAGVPAGVPIFFAVPKDGALLFNVGDRVAAAHYAENARRIQVSLPFLLNNGVRSASVAAALIGKHEAAHINTPGFAESRSHDDEAIQLVLKVDGDRFTYAITRDLLGNEDVNAAVTALFARREGALLPALAEASNSVISIYGSLSNAQKDAATNFAKAVSARALEVTDVKISQGLQIMAGQLLVRATLIEQGVAEAAKIRVTADPGDMLIAADKDRGPSYISRQSVLDAGIAIAKYEGDYGLYWRGWEGVSKLGNNIAQEAIYDQNTFSAQKDRMVMYVMVHLTGYHTTIFMHDRLPGSIQHLSTGPGHIQLTKTGEPLLDIKQVTRGTGIQYVKAYDANGNLASIMPQHLKPGMWIVSLPGTVDSIENLGALEFNDFTVLVSEAKAEEMLRTLNPNLDLKNIQIKRDVIERQSAVVPYYAVTINGVPYLVGQAYLRNGVPQAEIMLWAVGVYPQAPNLAAYHSAILSDETVVAKLTEMVAKMVVSMAWETREAAVNSVNSSNMSKYMEALAKLSEAFQKGLPVPVVPLRQSIKTGADGYRWGQPLLFSKILHSMGAVTEAQRIALAKQLGIISPQATPEEISATVIAENWFATGAIDMGTDYLLPIETLSLFKNQFFGQPHLAAFGPNIVITAKQLGSAVPLSIQSHDFDEMIVSQEAGYAYIGFKQDLTPVEMLKALVTGRIETLMNRVELNKGDMYTIPAGMVHAYGTVNVLEIKKVTPEQDRTGTRSFYDRLKMNDTLKQTLLTKLAEVENTVNPSMPNKEFIVLQELALRQLPPETVRQNKDALTMEFAKLMNNIRSVEMAGYLKTVNPQTLKVNPIIVTTTPSRRSKVELLSVNPGFTWERFTVETNEVLPAEYLINISPQRIYVESGTIEIRKETGQTIVLEPGVHLMPASEVRYQIRAVKGPATIYVDYSPSLRSEGIVTTAYQAMQNELARQKKEGMIERQPFQVWVPTKLYKRDMFKMEKSLISHWTGGLVTMRQYEDLSQIAPNANDVVVTIKTELTSARKSEKVMKMLSSIRMLTIPAKNIERDRTLFYAREVEATGVILGNTKMDDITDKTGRAIDLANIMRQMTGRQVSIADVGALISAVATSDSIDERFKKLIEHLLLTMPIERYEIDKGLESRRQVLWSV